MMNMSQGAPVDPVSRNPVPPGAMPKEVRDDIDIKASEGEYIIPADVVRFLGVEKIESLVNKAKESLAQLNQKGRIGGKPAPSPTRPPEPNNIAPPQPMGGPPRPRGMAEGGMVAQQPQGASTAPPQAATMVAYEGPDGRVVYIPTLNGNPITPVPAGYKQISGARQAVGQGSSPSSNRGTDFMTTPRGTQANKPTSPDQWSVDQFINYGQQLQSGVPDALMGAVGAILPFSNILMGLAERNMQSTVPGLIDQMIETGVDAQGNPISEEQMQGLVETKNTMADRIANETGNRFNPFESLSNFVGRLIGGGNQQSGSISTPPPSDSSGSGSPAFEVSGQISSAPDKEQQSGGTKTFAYGGLVNGSRPFAGFIQKQPPPQQKQPTPSGQPSMGFMNPNKKQPIIGA